jgi:Ubiquitin-activating enzyme E1 FCCH domain
MTEYSKMARGSFTSTGAAQVINLPFQPDYVEFFNYTLANTAATSQNVISGKWQYPMGQGTAVTQGYNATPTLIYDTVATGGISTFSAGQMLQFGPTLTVTVVSKANPASVTTSTAHGLKSGDVVMLEGLFETATTGMPQINGIPFTVTVTGTTTFTIPWNTNQSNYTAISVASTSAPRVKQILYPYLYFPGATVISNITLGTTTTIDTTDAHNFVVGQEVAFRIPTQWGTTQLNSLPNTTIPGSPVYGYVIAVTDYNTVVVNIDSSAYTAFTSNIAFTTGGFSFPQIVAVGDVNTGGVQISSGSALYPPPYSIPIGTTRVNTINGPAIQGAFVNNTSQGFIIGSGFGTVLTTGGLVGAAGNVIYWRAILHDLGIPV